MPLQPACKIVNHLIFELTCFAVKQDVFAGCLAEAQVVVGAPAIAKRIGNLGFFADLKIGWRGFHGAPFRQSRQVNCINWSECQTIEREYHLAIGTN